jgi:hypothetical protein
VRLNHLVKGRKPTQTRVAEIFAIPQPHVPELRSFKLGRFSSERLLHFVTVLDKDVEIIIRPEGGQSPGRAGFGAGCRLNRATQLHSFCPRDWVH